MEQETMEISSVPYLPMDGWLKTLIVLILGFGALGWMVVAVLFVWHLQQPSPPILDGDPIPAAANAPRKP